MIVGNRYFLGAARVAKPKKVVRESCSCDNDDMLHGVERIYFLARACHQFVGAEYVYRLSQAGFRQAV